MNDDATSDAIERHTCTMSGRGTLEDTEEINTNAPRFDKIEGIETKPVLRWESGTITLGFKRAQCENHLNFARHPVVLWVHESSQVQVILEEHLLPSAKTMFPQLRGLNFPTGQCAMPYSQSNQSLDGGSPDQEPVMASPISRFEPY
ncbi:hypothetical protein QTP70_024171 [Hemibagrus guttatus]|uniref:Uncharacterized protein n=1 Tax=Hemibagrus guttatus TaxID=175788 RepID=A0AAE0QGV2_9TELE|nr:hypothetical protein QTP70_024171 [Hemibagrus guttatus]